MSTRIQVSRRAFAHRLTALVAAVGGFGLAGKSTAQRRATPRRIGVLLVAYLPESREARAFRQGLRDAGYVEGRDVVIEWRSANGDYDRIREFAADLVHRKPDVIVVVSTPGTQAVERATSTIPIVMTVVGDPVGSGPVASLARPGGNVTGFSVMTQELWTKRLQLLKEMVPRLTRVAVLWNPETPWQPKAVEGLKSVAPSLSIQLSFVTFRTAQELGSAFSAMSRARAQALCVLPDVQLIAHRSTLLSLTSKARLPAIYTERRFVEDGGLMSYGANYEDLWRRAAIYVDKILKGADPGDLPIEQTAKFEFVVNVRTAKAMGLAIPQSVLLQVDEVIR